MIVTDDFHVGEGAVIDHPRSKKFHGRAGFVAGVRFQSVYISMDDDGHTIEVPRAQVARTKAKLPKIVVGFVRHEGRDDRGDLWVFDLAKNDIAALVYAPGPGRRRVGPGYFEMVQQFAYARHTDVVIAEHRVKGDM